MSTARRTILPARGGAHAGLILSRYMEHAPDSADYQKSKGDVKKDVINRAIAAVGDPELNSVYEKAFHRWDQEISREEQQYLSAKFKTETRLILGLGGTNVAETGLTLHHVYGVPYLPGSALKGIAARYARTILRAPLAAPRDGGSTQNFSRDHYSAIFGNTNEGGLIHFHDGWMLPESVRTCLLPDVMTPHHGDYYMADPESLSEPTDFDQPVPVAMLSIQGTFQVAVSTSHPSMTDAWRQTAMTFLSSALKQMGIGAKTSSGYGRMSETDRL